MLDSTDGNVLRGKREKTGGHTMRSLPKKDNKKQYQRPLLVVYGSMQELTRSTLTSTTGDNTQHTNNKRRGT